MQKLANIEPFEALANNAGAGHSNLSVFNPVENFDMVSEPNPTPRQDNNPQKAPVTTRSLDARVTRLEKDVVEIKQNMATKQDLAEMRQGIVSEINQKLDKLVR